MHICKIVSITENWGQSCMEAQLINKYKIDKELKSEQLISWQFLLHTSHCLIGIGILFFLSNFKSISDPIGIF